jgi:hypothetical protein
MIDGVNLHGRAERAYGSRLNPDLTLDQKPSGTIMCNIDALKQRRRIQAKARRGLNYPMPSCPAAQLPMRLRSQRIRSPHGVIAALDAVRAGVRQ